MHHLFHGSLSSHRYMSSLDSPDPLPRIPHHLCLVNVSLHICVALADRMASATFTLRVYDITHRPPRSTKICRICLLQVSPPPSLNMRRAALLSSFLPAMKISTQIYRGPNHLADGRAVLMLVREVMYSRNLPHVRSALSFPACPDLRPTSNYCVLIYVLRYLPIMILLIYRSPFSLITRPTFSRVVDVLRA